LTWHHVDKARNVMLVIKDMILETRMCFIRLEPMHLGEIRLQGLTVWALFLTGHWQDSPGTGEISGSSFILKWSDRKKNLKDLIWNCPGKKALFIIWYMHLKSTVMLLSNHDNNLSVNQDSSSSNYLKKQECQTTHMPPFPALDSYYW
jgi:hypothetical protein